MNVVLSSLCVGLSLLIIVCLERYAKGSRLFDRVSWCMSISADRWWDILDCPWSKEEQSFLDMIPVKYRINYANEDEIRDMKTIVDAYKRDLSSMYFHKRLRNDWKVVSLSNEQYFMFTIYGFLIENWDNREFEGQEMLHLESWETRGSEENSNSVRVYSLTDLAVVLNKMLYAANVFCRNSKGKALSNIISRTDAIADHLDTRRIEFF